MLNFIQIMRSLSNDRPVFYSEADFQHSLAWNIRSQHSACKLRLEYPISYQPVQHLDILCLDDDEVVAIELKYKVDSLMVTVKGENYYLKSHSAQDCGRYDYCLDVERIETYLKGVEVSKKKGYAIFLTNDHLDGDQSGRNTYSDAFHLHSGRALTGLLRWDPNTGKGTKAGREKDICLNGSYGLTWFDYSDVVPDLRYTGKSKFPTNFRYLIVEIS
jgi:hypothetical protein